MSGLPNVTQGRPLLVVDADEVLLQFLAGLEAWLPSRAAYLDLGSYQLTGNIRHAESRAPLEQQAVTTLLRDFHASAGLDLAPVDGAAEALADLSQHAQIVVLTNVAADLTGRRADNLRRHGIDFPVLANSGLKGSAFAALARAAGAPAFFVDDIPHHHASVAEAHPGARQIHLVADPRLFALARPAPEAQLFTSQWADAHQHILQSLETGGGASCG